MSDQTIVTWCPGGTCDPCDCVWEVNTPDADTVCKAPSIGIAAVTDSPDDRNKIVPGYIDVQLFGSWYGNAPPTSPPITFTGAILIQLNGASLLSIDPNLGAILDFVVSGTPPTLQWSATARVPFDCIMLGAEDEAYDFDGWPCVYPYTGDIVSIDPVTGIATPATLDVQVIIPPQDPIFGGLIPVPPGGIWSFPHVPGAVPVTVTITGRLYFYTNNATGEQLQFPPDHWAELVPGDGILQFLSTYPFDFSYAWFIDINHWTWFTWSFVTWGAPGGSLAQPTFVSEDEPGLSIYNTIGATMTNPVVYRSQ